MDNFFEILIYLLILVIGGIVSANRAKNKRRPASPPSSKPRFGPEFDKSTKPMNHSAASDEVLDLALRKKM